MIRRMSPGEMMVWAAFFAKESEEMHVDPAVAAAREVCALRGENMTAQHAEEFRKQMVEG